MPVSRAINHVEVARYASGYEYWWWRYCHWLLTINKSQELNIHSYICSFVAWLIWDPFLHCCAKSQPVRRCNRIDKTDRNNHRVYNVMLIDFFNTLAFIIQTIIKCQVKYDNIKFRYVFIHLSQLFAVIAYCHYVQKLDDVDDSVIITSNDGVGCGQSMPCSLGQK